MEFTFEITCGNQQFRTTIAGVTYKNKDGTERQELVKRLWPGQELTLVREPKNPHDKFAVAICTLSGQQLGYVHAGDARLAYHMDMGGPVVAKVVEVTGGPGLMDRFFSSESKSYGCVIEITKGDLDWQQARPYMEKSKEIEGLLFNAKLQEVTNVQMAVATYRKAIEQIAALDSSGKFAAGWRRVRYPINRLSMTLEKCGDADGAYREIMRYETYKDKDAYGLTPSETKSVDARKKRLAKKLGL